MSIAPRQMFRLKERLILNGEGIAEFGLRISNWGFKFLVLRF